jgi:hypothetical protein
MTEQIDRTTLPIRRRAFSGAAEALAGMSGGAQ